MKWKSHGGMNGWEIMGDEVFYSDPESGYLLLSLG